MIAITSSFQLNAPRAVERERLSEAATKFEAIFARQMLASARKASLGDDLFGSQGLDTFRQMMDDRFADILAQSGSLGLGKSIETQLAAHLGLTDGTAKAGADAAKVTGGKE